MIPTPEQVEAIRKSANMPRHINDMRGYIEGCELCNYLKLLALLDEVFEKIGEAVEAYNATLILRRTCHQEYTADKLDEKVDALRSLREKYGVKK